MSHSISFRLALAALLAVAVLPAAARGQFQDSQSQSVAEAARRAREQKKAAAKQPSPVITDDTLKRTAPPPQSATASAPAQSPDAAPAASDSSKVAAPAATADDAKKKEKAAAELAALKQQLAEAQKNLDILQRELALEQDNVYSKPNYQNDTAGKSRLDDFKQQIADKRQAVSPSTSAAILSPPVRRSRPAARAKLSRSVVPKRAPR